jgi:inositol 1,4,5-triphosphate receptor type 3
MGNLKSIIFDFKVGFDDVIERVGVKRIKKLQSTSFWKFESID